ncbi:Uncharacterised protein [Legionella beliardensis]|uniref:Uncharacterized protein n=1 Tax=Legionella beliardensis TaxID=91822 RepID=A0A378I0I3_9GAMM|nr:hypothetical protein [Legionella beliardensis]STX28482.1 Uncharacterised protein [Legionella beliardensis]
MLRLIDGIEIKIKNNMKKIIIALSLIPIVTFAITNEQKEAMLKASIEVLKKQGLVTPNSGVQVLSRQELMSSDWQKKKELEQPHQLKTKGYIHETSNRAYELLHFQEVIKRNKAIEAKMHRPDESHMRHHVDDMLMAYQYVGVPQSEMTEFIGIAPAGTYVKEPAMGWSGAVEFFKTSFGTCAYIENNLTISHGAVRVAEEDATSDVNGKVTLVDVRGNENSGFLYQVEWFDNNFIRTLECANEKYSPDITKAVIELAIRTDKA